MTLQAIETQYNGYRFRSRLEARYAVLFDQLGIEYLYEHQGYYLGSDLGNYLPDFYIPSRNAFFEIKGRKPSPVEKEKIGRLVSQSEGAIGYILFGNVDTYLRNVVVSDNGGFFYNIKSHVDGNYGFFKNGKHHHLVTLQWFSECPRCGSVWLSTLGKCDYYICNCNTGRYGFASDRIKNAMWTASTARFEFGETPEAPR